MSNQHNGQDVFTERVHHPVSDLLTPTANSPAPPRLMNSHLFCSCNDASFRMSYKQNHTMHSILYLMSST